MNEISAYEQKFNILVEESVKSGVKPLELRFQPACDCNYGEIRAIRSELRVNSVLAGVIDPENYLAQSDEQTLTEISLKAIDKAIKAINALESRGVRYKFLSVKVDTAIALNADPYSLIKTALEKASATGEKLCLEFPASVTDISGEKLKNAFSDIRAAKVKIAVGGYGGENFAMEKLLSACPNVIYTDPTLAKLALSDEKAAAVAPMLNFAKSLGAEIIADGVENDDELREFRSRDALAFIPSENYRGNTAVKKGFITLKDVIGGNDYD